MGSSGWSVVVSAATVGFVMLAACSSDGSKTTIIGAPTCDSSKCLPGNTCLPLNGDTKCRKTCASNDDPATSCPFDYICKDTDPAHGIPPFCVATTGLTNDGQAIQQKSTGQWGTACQANLGADGPDCDTAQGFHCFGASPTDANAYCTRFDCLTDDECGPGFGCADVNQTPNVGQAKRKGVDVTQKVCVRRAYCSACATDVDCTTAAGKKQFCVVDTAGRGFCSPQCTGNQECNTEARCAVVTLSNGGTDHLCYPRSSVCIGNGALCAGCQSDADCGTDGICTHGVYTNEKFCAKQAPGGDCTQCPKSIDGLPDRKVGCTNADSDITPKGYCVGIIDLSGKPADFGCWSPDR